MLALHGTKRKFNKFKTKHAAYASFGFGFYFYPNNKESFIAARRFAGKKSGYILTVELDIKNPLHVCEDEGSKLWDSICDERAEFIRDEKTGRVFDDVFHEWLESDDENLEQPNPIYDRVGYMKFIQEWLEDNRYDSIYNAGRDEFVVFDEDRVNVIARMPIKTGEWEKI